MDVPPDKNIAKKNSAKKVYAMGGILGGGEGTISTPQLVEPTDLILFNKWYIAQCQRNDGKALSSINLCPMQSVGAKCFQ